MNSRSFIKMDPKLKSLVIESLPVWNGVNTKPKSLKVAPFVLGRDGGFFRQLTAKHTLDQLFDYSNQDYQHGTPPPADAVMQKARAMSFLQHINQLCGGVVGKSVLELGAGSTFIGEYLTDHAGAASYLAIDPSIKDTPKSKKCRVIRDFFDSVMIDESFDLIFSIATLEHAIDPEGFLTKAKSLLKDANSVLITIVPNIEPEFVCGDWNAFAHEHVQYFYPTTLSHMHAASGLFLSEVYGDKRTLYLSATKGENPKKSGRNDAYVLPEVGDIAAAFNRSANYLKDRLIEFGNLRVAFYGATNGLNNILHVLGLTDSSLQIFDTDPLKVGKYVPACDAIVRNGTDCTSRDFDVVIISAMQFYAEIKKFLVEKQGFDAKNIVPVTPIS